MATEVKTIRGVAWDHPRAIGPLLATAEAFSVARPDIHVVWERRSIESFAFAPVSDLALKYDLVVIDHPHVGQALSEALLPLDEWLAEDYLADQAHESVGPSHRSYQWRGHQWALAIDAAAQVAAYRGDLLAQLALPLPATWEDVLRLADALPSGVRIAIPLSPIDAACALMSIGVNLAGPDFWHPEEGYDHAALTDSLALLRNLARRSDPRSTASNPPALLDAMAHDDSIAYAPLTFGYSNYARRGYARRMVSFTDIPTAHTGPVGSVLGGAGLAVSRRSRHRSETVAYAEFVASPDVQRGTYFEGGGQPGHRRSWTDPAVNAASGSFFQRTLATVDGAYLRPRLAEDPAFLHRQRRVGDALHAGLAKSDGLASLVTAVRRAARAR